MKTAKPTDSDWFLATRQSLLTRLRNRNERDQWLVFFDTYWTLIYKAALHAGLTAAEAEEVVQETVLCVFKSLPGFDYNVAKGGFKGWLMRLTTRRIIDQIRRRTSGLASAGSPEADSAEDLATIDQMAGLRGQPFESIWDQEWELNLLESAMNRVKATVDPKQFQIFDLLVRKEWPVARVADDLKINVASIYMAKYRVGRAIRKEIECLRTKPI